MSNGASSSSSIICYNSVVNYWSGILRQMVNQWNVFFYVGNPCPGNFHISCGVIALFDHEAFCVIMYPARYTSTRFIGLDDWWVGWLVEVCRKRKYHHHQQQQQYLVTGWLHVEAPACLPIWFSVKICCNLTCCLLYYTTTDTKIILGRDFSPMVLPAPLHFLHVTCGPRI